MTATVRDKEGPVGGANVEFIGKGGFLAPSHETSTDGAGGGSVFVQVAGDYEVVVTDERKVGDDRDQGRFRHW